ncbi:DUF1127 domain-containing protein [Microbaculum sp. FT89]|uniref:DUF1127 domain-containing protein n=1 Tax=Microbaculum sp. FT89 TaxID=3447298 RepID=UPI003F52BAEE
MLNYPVIPLSQRQAAMPVSTSIVSAFARGLRMLARGYWRWRTSRELHALDDRTLKDIGLSRSEIGYVATTHAGERMRLLNGDRFHFER